MGVKYTKLYLLLILEVFILIMALVIFSNMGNLGVIIRDSNITHEALQSMQNLYLIQAIMFLVLFLSVLFFIISELNFIAKAKKNLLLKHSDAETETSTLEEETEEVRLEKEKLKREKYEKLLKEFLDCIDQHVGKAEKFKNHKQISEKVLSCVSKFYEITQAEIFVRQTTEQQEDKLVMSSTYAFYVPEEKVFEFNIGEGLIGQVAKAGKSLYLDSIPEGYIQVKSGLGSATPSHLLICPWKDKDNNVFAVIEIAAFKAFSVEDIEIIEEISSKLADIYNIKTGI
jgi:hypothetical protein